jgi:CRISPR-associated protein Csy3
MATELKTASVLAFERKLDPSDALMYAGSWAARAQSDGWQPVTLREKSVRGTISNRPKVGKEKADYQDPLKLNAKLESPNLQTVDVATLPADADTLKVQFTLRVLGGTGQPSACNDAGYREKLQSTVSGYVANPGFAELARRYAANLANGRFLWRNRIGAEQVEVTIAQIKDGEATRSWTFDALSHDMNKLSPSTADRPKLEELGNSIAGGLGGASHVLLQITAFVRVGAGQEVFPSQELILDKGAIK